MITNKFQQIQTMLKNKRVFQIKITSNNSSKN
jgi:hypothetical protein